MHRDEIAKWASPGQPGELRQTPWLHPSIVLYLDAIIQPDWSILEHGAGGSTLWFAQRAARVVSIEHHPDWREAVAALAPDNVTMMDDEIDIGYGREFDLFLIDGQRQMRASWALIADELVKPGGLVVFDNCNRPDEQYPLARLHLQETAYNYITFQVCPPNHKYAVTEIYRMPGGELWL